MAVDVTEPASASLAHSQTALPAHSPPLASTKDSPAQSNRPPTHFHTRSASLTFHPALRATHQRSLSRSLSIIAPPTAHAHTYVPSQRASQALTSPSTHPTPPIPTPNPVTQPTPAPTTTAATAAPPARPAAASIHRPSLAGFDGCSAKVLLVGAPYAGKSALLQRLIGGCFDDGYVATLRIELALYLMRDEQFNSLELWDVPCGAHIEEVLQPLYMQGVHAAVIVADLTDLRSFIAITRYIALFTATTPTLPFPVLLLANKADSPDRVLSDASVAEWAERHRVAQSHVVSAKSGLGVEAAFRSIVGLVERFVPLPAHTMSHSAGNAVAGGAGTDATQRLLSLLHTPGAAAARRSPSHTPSPSNRNSASLTPTSRTRASSLLTTSLLRLSTHLAQPSTSPRPPLPLPLPAASPRAAAVGRSAAYSHSALAVQRLTGAGGGVVQRAGGASLSGLWRGEAGRDSEVSRSGSRAEETETVLERRTVVLAGGSGSPLQLAKPAIAASKAFPAAGVGVAAAKRAPLHSPIHREVDLRF